MVYSFLSFKRLLADAFIFLPAFLLVLSVHEAAHALVAYLLGDSTAKKMGRLTLNPLKHIDPVGLLCLFVFRIGWAKPVMFNYNNFKRPKIYSVLTAYAGPVSNFILAIVVMLFVKFFPYYLFSYGVAVTIRDLGMATAEISVMLGVFNLLPIPPLDGSHILMVFMIDRFPKLLFWMYRYSLFILVIFLMMPLTRNGLHYMIETVFSFLRGLIF